MANESLLLAEALSTIPKTRRFQRQQQAFLIEHFSINCDVLIVLLTRQS